MTEQENREKAIEELAQFMCETKDKMTCEECKREPNVQCGAWNEATRLYDAGYRKADEVRKETAKEFIELFHKYVIISEDTFDGTVKMNITDAVKMNEEIEKRFGVEVEG